MIKTVFLGLILGTTLGVSLAAEVFSRIGIQPAVYLLILAGLLIATLLVNRGVAVLAAVIVLSVIVLQSEQVLQSYGFDRDFLLAALLLTILYPVVHRVMQS